MMPKGSGPYWDFWEQFRARVADEHPDWKTPNTRSRTSPWSDVATGTKGTALTSRFYKRKGLVLQITLNDQDDPALNKARFEALQTKKDQFEKALGESATWDEMTGTQSARVYVASPFSSINDIDQWLAMMNWLMDQHVRFKRAIQAVGGLDSLA